MALYYTLSNTLVNFWQMLSNLYLIYPVLMRVALFTPKVVKPPLFVDVDVSEENLCECAPLDGLCLAIHSYVHNYDTFSAERTTGNCLFDQGVRLREPLCHCQSNTLASAIFLGVYEPVKQKLLKAIPENFSSLAHLSAGAIAGAASSIVRVPTEVVKQRMQMGQFATAPNAVRMIVSKEGFRGLYAGYGSFLLRDLPFDAIQFCIYEQIRIGYKLAAKRELNDPENALIGAFAGAITGAITTPLDVIKTRLMIQGSSKQYKGVYDCVRTIPREEGGHVFMKGIGPRVLWIGIGGSIFFGVLEKTKQVLSQGQPNN
ncbi:probable S-adenosylmethionine carrier 2, chloroplastic [Chenopodium quinoa]|uniref:probable S-adenosylmethionine carrier 2, chloroplastic n=1 Tax=Chenopodium quinoa TaxID=63459 RepID=UPI000B791D89|nr:probable S-adenosylmethionine carrier 2, chloroplastic [Chenopodium quinoa]